MKTRYIYFILFYALWGSSCTERVTFELDEAGEPRLVVFAEITNEKMAHELTLSKSAPYFSNQSPEMVSNAVVEIDDGIRQIQLREDETHPGVYLTPTDFFGVVGRQYRLDISNVDINNDGETETYWAETEMKPTPTVDGVIVAYNQTWEGWEVGIFSKDDPGREDFYLFKVYKNGILYTDSVHEYWVTDDRFFNGNDINGPVVQYFNEDEGEIVEEGDTITLEMAGITDEYFHFLLALDIETSERVPLFSGPPANLKGNISNGALGFFAVMEIDRNFTIYNGETTEF